MIQARFPGPIRVGVVLGSGLGAFAEGLRCQIPFGEIPHMPVPGVAGHGGALAIGMIEGVAVACLSGRVHLYEGHEPSTVVFGVRLLRELGCREVLLTNAAGGIHPQLRAGECMLLSDHLNFTGKNPLVGLNVDAFGPRFPDMTAVYDRDLRNLAHAAARRIGAVLRDGVYAGMLGPSYETPAEIRMLRTLGADAVGMSTILEAIALHHMGIPTAAISCITNMAAGISATPLNHQEVERVARAQSDTFAHLLTEWISLIGLDAELPSPSSRPTPLPTP